MCVVCVKATKFSGSSDSYLVVKTCESRMEAASAVCGIGEGLLEISRDVSGAGLGGFSNGEWGVAGFGGR